MGFEGGGHTMSEDAFRAGLTSIVMFEESLAKPFIDAGFPRLPTPAYALLRALEAQGEEEKEEEGLEEVKEIRVVVPRFG